LRCFRCLGDPDGVFSHVEADLHISGDVLEQFFQRDVMDIDGDVPGSAQFLVDDEVESLDLPQGSDEFGNSRVLDDEGYGFSEQGLDRSRFGGVRSGLTLDVNGISIRFGYDESFFDLEDCLVAALLLSESNCMARVILLEVRAERGEFSCDSGVFGEGFDNVARFLWVSGVDFPAGLGQLGLDGSRDRPVSGFGLPFPRQSQCDFCIE